MIVFVDNRESVRKAYGSQFEHEGIACTILDTSALQNWLDVVLDEELLAVRAWVFDCASAVQIFTSEYKLKLTCAKIALCDTHRLDRTLQLYGLGVDDVARKPVHAREIIARIAAIERRVQHREIALQLGRLKIYFDGRDTEIDGKSFPLPRREKRILEYLASIGRRRASKIQIFNNIYGSFNDDIEHAVIESHLSKLRKKLRVALNHDPIDSKRYQGYRLVG